jgi:hypothetical protein
MAKYLVLYRSTEAAAARVAQATPEEQQAGIQTWMEWFGQAGSAIAEVARATHGGSIETYALLPMPGQLAKAAASRAAEGG